MATSFEIEEQKLKRQQQLAEAMMASGLEPIQTQRTAGPYVAPVHLAEVLGKWAQVYAGKRASNKNYDRQLEAATARDAAVSEQLQSLFQTGQQPTPTPATPPANPLSDQVLTADLLEGNGVAPAPKPAAPAAPAVPAPSPQAAAPQPTQPTPPAGRGYANEITALEQRRNQFLLATSSQEPRVAAVAAAQVKAIDDQLKIYREAEVQADKTLSLGQGYIYEGGTARRVTGEQKPPKVEDKGSYIEITNYDWAGNSTVSVRTKPQAARITVEGARYASKLEEVLGRAAGAEITGIPAQMAQIATTRRQAEIMNDALKTSGTTGPITPLVNSFMGLAQDLGFALDTETVNAMKAGAALDRTKIARLMQIFQSPGMSAYGLTEKETKKIMDSLGDSATPQQVIRAITAEIRATADRQENWVRSRHRVIRNANPAYADMIDQFSPDAGSFLPQRGGNPFNPVIDLGEEPLFPTGQ